MHISTLFQTYTNDLTNVSHEGAVLCVRAHRVFLLAFQSVHGVGASVQAGGHFESFDVLGYTHSAGSLSNDACEAHLPLQVQLSKDSMAFITHLNQTDENLWWL